MNFGESVLFAAIMTLMDEIKNGNEKNFSANIDTVSFEDNIPAEITYDAPIVKNKLCGIVQDLFDKADEVCQTQTDTSAAELIPSIINGIIFEAAESIIAVNDVKKEVYEFVMQQCAIDSAYPWELLCAEDDELARVLVELSNIGMDSIVLASSKGKMEEACAGFIRLMVELMLYLEDAINKNFGRVVFNKRPPIMVLEKAIAACKKEMKRMEDEDPTIKEHVAPPKERANLERLFQNARAELNNENMSTAAAYYREILKIDPNDWEASFYSVFCAVHRAPYATNANEIPSLTAKLVKCSPTAMRLAKNKLFSRMDIITGVGDLAVRVCHLTSNYFVAAMNTFKASSGGSTANMSKILQVSSIINMVFAVGDSIEEAFGEDFEIVKNISCNCWKIGFDCYENCNMPAPPKLYDHYLKILKYEPTFRCSKPLSGGSSAGSSEGCYIATAVYGSYDCPQVWTLRRYRDYSLAQTWFGRAFIRFYYATSPTFVRLFKGTKWFNAVFRKLLDKFTKHLIANGYKNTPYVDGVGSKTRERI